MPTYYFERAQFRYPELEATAKRSQNHGKKIERKYAQFFLTRYGESLPWRRERDIRSAIPCTDCLSLPTAKATAYRDCFAQLLSAQVGNYC